MRFACSRDALLILLRAIDCALVQPIGQPVVGAEFGNEARNVIAALPSTRRALDAKDIKHSDQTAYRSVAGVVRDPCQMAAETLRDVARFMPMRSASEQTVRGRVTVVQCIENATQCDEMAAATDNPDIREAFDNAAASWRDLARLMTSIEQTMETYRKVEPMLGWKFEKRVADA
jgi:hypothetical protein